MQMSGPKCAEKVQNSLQDVGSVQIDVPTGRVVVNTNLPWVEIQEKIERTGRRAVLSGFGGAKAYQILLNMNSSANHFHSQTNQLWRLSRATEIKSKA